MSESRPRYFPYEYFHKPEMVTTSDGTELAYETFGNEEGVPIFMHHGMPGGRRQPIPTATHIRYSGARLITYDRPGYGDSPRSEGRTVADAARHVEAIADALKIDQFYVIGRSAGGPHALATSALLGERVLRTYVLATLKPTPANRENRQWVATMAKSNVAAYSADEETAIEDITQRYLLFKNDRDSILDNLMKRGERFPYYDRILLEREPDLLFAVRKGYVHGLKNGPEGWLDDLIALRRPWGFALDAIKTPVSLWVGDEDPFTPVSHSEEVVRQINKPEITNLRIVEGLGHFATLSCVPLLIKGIGSAHIRGKTLETIPTHSIY